MSGIVQGLLASIAESGPFEFTISSSQTNLNLRTAAVNAGWNQSSEVICTINSGVYINSNSTGIPALTVNGSFPKGVRLNNSGIIVGRGGSGGRGAGITSGPTYIASTPGNVGGTALLVSVALTLNNTGTIAGGGGGGGGAGSRRITGYEGANAEHYGGGGGGGGRSSQVSAVGGTGGAASGGALTNIPGNTGATGTVSAFGTGGAGGITGIAGGNGGGWGSAGSTGQQLDTGTNRTASAGGGGGAAISGNSNITYISTGTRLGSIS